MSIGIFFYSGRFARAQTQIDEARIACALERYRLANGHWPETLDALSPKFIQAVPRDIINGQPLKYRLADDGRFILYSVGWNEKDDGGAFRSVDKASGADHSQRGYINDEPEEGDWVWQYPEK